MANKSEVAGVSANRQRPLVIPVADAPENQFMSKTNFMKRREAEKAATAAGEAARLKVLSEHGMSPATPQPAKVSAEQVKLDKLRKALADAEQKLQGSPDSKAFAKRVKTLSEELEVAEAESTE